LAQEPFALGPSLGPRRTMATGADGAAGEASQRATVASRPCSRRCSRRLAGKLGLIGRLAASGRLRFEEAQVQASQLLRAAQGTAAPSGEADQSLWLQACRRARQQRDSIYFHLRHCALRGKAVPKARLASYLARDVISGSEAREAAAAHAQAI